MEDAAPRKDAKQSNYQISRILAARLAAMGLTPYKSDRDRFLITIPEDGGARELIELGPAIKGGRFFRSNSATKDISLVNEFAAFCKEIGLTDCYFWSVCLPVRKAAIDKLHEELCRFNRQINDHFSELRKLYRFEQLVLAVHVRYDDLTDAIDLHAHFVCRVPPEHLEQVRQSLRCGFSRPDLDVGPIRNLPAVINYMLYGIFNNREMVEWPDHALAAVWQLSQQKRFRYVRTGGAFAKWRRQARLANDNGPTKIKRQQPFPVDPTRPRFLARVTAKIRGKRVAALLYEYPAEAPVNPTKEKEYSTASRLVTQEPIASETSPIQTIYVADTTPLWRRIWTAAGRIMAPISSWPRKTLEIGKTIARKLLNWCRRSPRKIVL